MANQHPTHETVNPVTGEITIEQGEIEAAASMAIAAESEATFDRQGRLLRTVITTKDFLAGREAFDFVNGLSKGTIVTLGTLAGLIRSVESREKEYPAGSGVMLKSYWLHGTFEAVISNGEVLQAAQAILPRKYGVQVYNAFRDTSVQEITVGVSIGLALSGRAGIPYEWSVRDHMTVPAIKRVAAISAQLGELLGVQALVLPEATKSKPKRIAAG